MNRPRIRCMGGARCNHLPGLCTADPEYQKQMEVSLKDKFENLVEKQHTQHIVEGLTNVSHEALQAATELTLPVGFGIALIALKLGKRITRTGWNGKGMYLYMVQAGRYPASTRAGARIAAQQPDYCVPYRPYVAMFTVDQDVVPWVCSQSDLLMEDWLILED